MAEIEVNPKNKFYSNKALHKMLTSSISGGHLCHAYLLYGQKLIGKKTLAKNFAMAILCKNQDKPCYYCNSCQKILSKNHPDLYLYEGKRGKNALHIETIRQIRQDAYIRPNESDYKIYIVPNAQDMTISAANAFLKILEEPPPYAVFILTADAKQSVPETILSRCIPFEVFPMTIEEEIDVLNELVPDKSPDDIARFAEISNGNLGRAIDFLTDTSYNEMVEMSRKAVNAIINKREYDLLVAINKASASRVFMLELITELAVMVRNAIVHKLAVKLSSDELVVSLSYSLTLQQMDNIQGVLENARRGIEGNVNMSLLANNLTALLIKAIN
ncbi:MAG: DNA polymerase III subunit [Oscillospiraceae bacterium]